VSFLIAWFASIASRVALPGADTVPRGAMAAFACVLGLVLVAGAQRLASHPTDRTVRRVATIGAWPEQLTPHEITLACEGRIPADPANPLRVALARANDGLLAAARREARAGATLVLWPEANALVDVAEAPQFLRRAAQLAAAEHVEMLMGVGVIHPGTPRPFENVAFWIDATGHTRLEHTKSHAVPGWEASIMRPGAPRLAVAHLAAGRSTASICFETDFPSLIRQAGRARADLLGIVANDARGFAAIHAQMARARAIENGTPIVRAASHGTSAAWDACGRPLATLDAFAPGAGTMVAQVPSGAVPTLYARWGDWFAWLCVAALAALFAATLASPVQRATAGRGELRPAAMARAAGVTS